MAWHPYAYPSAMFETNFVSDNAAMFSTMALNGDSNIPVYFTEFGISNINTPGGTESEVTAGLMKLLDEIQDNMPQVVGTMLYRGVDSGSDSGTGTADWGLLKTDLTRKGRDASFCAMTWCSPYVGLFNFNNTYYWSNGSTAYCSLASWDVAKQQTGVSDIYAIPHWSVTPPSLHNDGVCALH